LGAWVQGALKIDSDDGMTGRESAAESSANESSGSLPKINQ
jgi:hypothetical protein